MILAALEAVGSPVGRAVTGRWRSIRCQIFLMHSEPMMAISELALPYG